MDKIIYFIVNRFSVTSKVAWIISSYFKLFVNKTAFFLQYYFLIFSIFLFFDEFKESPIYLLIKSIEIQFLFIVPYGVIEMMYLLGNSWAKEALESIFPMMYDIGINHGWWPPLHWPGMRNIFPEASFFAIYASIAFVIMVYAFYSLNKKRYLFYSLIISFFCFSTNCRTSVLLWGALFVFIVVSLISDFRYYFKYCVAVSCIVIFSFLLSSFMLMYSPIVHPEKQGLGLSERNVVGTYIDDNIKTITSSTARSNAARFGNMKAAVKVWLKHPFLGVSNMLSAQYMIDEILPYAESSSEIRLWISYVDNILSPQMNVLSGYLYSCVSGGIIELLLVFGILLYGSFRLCIMFVHDIFLRKRVSYFFVALLSVMAVICASEITARAFESVPFIICVEAIMVVENINYRKGNRSC